MFSNKEFERAYTPVWSLTNIKKELLDDFNSKWDLYNALNNSWTELDSVDDVESNLQVLIKTDVLVCYFALGYPLHYDDNTYELSNLLSYALSSQENYIFYEDYKNYCTSPYFETSRGYQPRMFELIKNIATKSPGVLLFYKILKDINSPYADDYINALQTFAHQLSERSSFVKAEGRIWLRKLMLNPTSLCNLPQQEYIIKDDEIIADHVSKDYYDYLDKVATELNDFLNNFLFKSSPLRYYLSTHQMLSKAIHDQDSVITFIKIFVFKDVCKLYKKLNHSINIDTIEGKFLLLFLSKSQNFEVDFETFNRRCDPNTILDEDFLVREKSMDLIMIYNDQTFDLGYDGLIMKNVLDNVDKDLSKKYMVILYRISSAIAKADGNISEEESRWLSDLMSTGIDVEEKTETIINNDEQDPIKELETLIGLNTVKKDVVSLANFIKMKQMRESKGLKAPNISYHCVFTGNPGTGKTTVARILAKIFKELGILKIGHLVETDRSGLVAEYVGQTAVKTNQIIDSALDGVLFVDEAYTLVGGQNDYGKEAIATLLKRMEDDRDRLIVILAGYSKEMEDFINSNPGLRSRFNRYIYFPDYSSKELFDIFQLNVKRNEYEMTDDANVYLENRLNEVVSHHLKDFGNARYVRNYFEMAIEHQANRLAFENDLSADKISELTIEDISVELKQNIQGLHNLGF